jgi:peptidyl-prolyl cis-trans isomerase D
LFALKEGQVSVPVKTEFGYHLIKLKSIEINEIPSLDEMRGALEERLRQEESDELYAEMTEKLADISYSSPDLAESSDELAIEIKQLAGISKETSNEIFSSPKIQKLLFSDDLVLEHNNSELVEVAEGRAIVFRVNAFHEASILPLASVKEKVRDVLKAKKSAEFAASVGQAYIARVSAGEDPLEVSEEMGLNWQAYKKIKRDNVMVNREVVTKVFTLKKEQELKDNIYGFDILGGDYAVVLLDDIHEGEAGEASALELSSISNMLSDSLGAVDYRNYQDVAVKTAEVERL